MKHFKVAPNAASELDIYHEVLECGDHHGRLISQWDGTHVVAFDKEHASALAKIACEWSNDIDRDLEGGRYDHERSLYRSISIGLSNLSVRLSSWAHS